MAALKTIESWSRLRRYLNIYYDGCSPAALIEQTRSLVFHLGVESEELDDIEKHYDSEDQEVQFLQEKKTKLRFCRFSYLTLTGCSTPSGAGVL